MHDLRVYYDLLARSPRLGVPNAEDSGAMARRYLPQVSHRVAIVGLLLLAAAMGWAGIVWSDWYFLTAAVGATAAASFVATEPTRS